MPFIRGRYHVNPIMGEALEAAREAEAALLALEQEAQQNRDGESDDDADAESSGRGPIHRVEIEAAELVPSHSGRAARGFVARVHRQPAVADGDESTATAAPAIPTGSAQASRGFAQDKRSPGAAAKPETHVFSDHRDLVNFLSDELGRDGKK